jgi:Fur family ferric uptake transcriptional regulator
MNNNIEDRLVSKNTKPTSMRSPVYNYLSSQKTALSLAEIESHFQYTDRITIYRTLKLFEDKGIVHSIQENNTTRYWNSNSLVEGFLGSYSFFF